MIPEHIHLGVLGVGRWGANLIRCFGDVERCAVDAVCDVDPERLRQVSGLGVRRYGNPAAIFGDPALDAIVISTPARSHAGFAVAALEAGKHVFVEKPLALSLTDAHRVRDAARRNDRQVMVGHLLRYHPAVATLKALLDKGTLGTVGRIATLRLGPRTTPGEEGPWWSLAPHDISLVRFLFGTEVSEVAALRRDFGSGRAEVRARIRLGTAMADLFVSTAHPQKVRRLIVTGTRGTAVFDDGGSKASLITLPGDNGGDSLDEAALAQLSLGVSPPGWVVMDVPRLEPLACEARHFISAIAGNTPVATDVEEGCRVVAALEAGALSFESDGAWIRVPVTPARRSRDFGQDLGVT